MARLRDLAKLIRSKNAGPFQLTFDIMFDDEPTYKRVRDSGVINKQLFSKLYNTPEEKVFLVAYDPGLAIKATIPRPVFSGDLEDTDVFGGQFYGPIVDIEVP